MLIGGRVVTKDVNKKKKESEEIKNPGPDLEIGKREFEESSGPVLKKKEVLARKKIWGLVLEFG